MGEFTRLIINRFTPKSATIKIQNKNILGKNKNSTRESTETVGGLEMTSHFLRTRSS